MTGLAVEDIRLTWPGTAGASLTGVSLAVPPGGVTALVGPSGCGKSSLLRVIAGLATPDGGRVRIGGADVTDLPPERRRTTMMVQETLLFPHMSVAGNIGFGLRMRGRPAAEIATRVDALLELVRLPGFAGRRPETLSGGQAQRVALARALAVQPEVLLLDEPLAALDPELRADLRETILAAGRDSGTTMLFVTHDRDEAVAVGERIALMLDGAIAQEGAAEDLFERPLSAKVASFFGASNILVGQVEAGRFVGLLGSLEIASPGPDGPATLVIRPEAIRLGDGPGSLAATVVSLRYRGTHRLLEADAGGVRLTVALPTGGPAPAAAGARVPLVLPPDRLWRLPQKPG
jgi:ABC-type Fe3+/spermidine/putrescine transport system ATPase subunit